MNTFERIRSHYENNDIASFEVPEWGMTVYSRPLTPHKLNLIESYGKEKGTASSMLAMTVKVSLEDEEGNLIFNDPGNKQGKLQWLERECSAELLSGIIKGLKLATADDLDVLAEEHEKNSESAPADS